MVAECCWLTFQAEDFLSRVDQLKELIEQSENVININLDSQRNIMLRLSLQLEMGMFSASVCGLIGVAFGMNLDSSLEEVKIFFNLAFIPLIDSLFSPFVFLQFSRLLLLLRMPMHSG